MKCILPFQLNIDKIYFAHFAFCEWTINIPFLAVVTGNPSIYASFWYLEIHTEFNVPLPYSA